MTIKMLENVLFQQLKSLTLVRNQG